MKNICKDISKLHKISFNLSDVLQMLLSTRLIAPYSKLSSYEFASKFLQQPNFELQHVYRSLDVFSKYSDYIQASVYENCQSLIKRNKEVLFYDCTNYFFEMEEGKGNIQYGKSKEHRPNPIIQMGLFLDGDGFPLCFCLLPDNKNEQPSLKPLEKKILRDFNLSKFILCTDAGLASTENRKFNAICGRSYIVTQSLKKLKGFLNKWALDNSGWFLKGSSKSYDISKIDEEVYKDAIFYKERWINENGLEQRLIVSYSIKQRNYQRFIREKQVQRAEKIVNESMYDGFYAVCTTLEKDANEIIHINKMRRQIEAAFRTMKSEFKARPVFLRNEERINTHFLTCFLSLLILRIIEKKTDNKYTSEQILHTLRNMNVHRLRDLGYLSSYERTEITDALHESFGFRTDSEFISEKTMKKIFKQVEKS